MSKMAMKTFYGFSKRHTRIITKLSKLPFFSLTRELPNPKNKRFASSIGLSPVTWSKSMTLYRDILELLPRVLRCRVVPSFDRCDQARIYQDRKRPKEVASFANLGKYGCRGEFPRRTLPLPQSIQDTVLPDVMRLFRLYQNQR